MDRGAQRATVHGLTELDTTEVTWHTHRLVNSSLPTVSRDHLLKEPSMTISLPDLRRRPTLYFSFKPLSTVTNERNNYFLCLSSSSMSRLRTRLLPALFPPPHLYPAAQWPARSRSSSHILEGWLMLHRQWCVLQACACTPASCASPSSAPAGPLSPKEAGFRETSFGSCSSVGFPVSYTL